MKAPILMRGGRGGRMARIVTVVFPPARGMEREQSGTVKRLSRCTRSESNRLPTCIEPILLAKGKSPSAGSQGGKAPACKAGHRGFDCRPTLQKHASILVCQKDFTSSL